MNPGSVTKKLVGPNLICDPFPELMRPGELDFLTLHIIENEVGKLSFFTRYQRFGPPLPECAVQVVQSAPDVVFISCFAFCYAYPALELARQIGILHPHVVIVMGGAGVSAYPGLSDRP